MLFGVCFCFEHQHRLGSTVPQYCYRLGLPARECTYFVELLGRGAVRPPPQLKVCQGWVAVCPGASAPHDPGCVPDHVYSVGSMTPLLACGWRCVLPHGPVYLSPARLAARAHPNRVSCPLWAGSTGGAKREGQEKQTAYLERIGSWNCL
jgi:hypothetical protein